MVQAVDNNVTQPTYNAVKINIKKPEVNASNNINTYTNDNGIYNAVSIDIDNPVVNPESKKIYDYPVAEGPVTYDRANLQQIQLPKGFVTYHTTNVILPKMENELEIESSAINQPDEVEEEVQEEVKVKPEAETEAEAETAAVEENKAVTEQAIEEEPAGETENKVVEQEETKPEVPAPNYTTTEAEKGVVVENNADAEKTETEKSDKTEEVSIKKPEIIPSEDIVPEVDIPLIVSNLTSEDFDTQALQMEEIARISLDNPENAVPYIVRDVFGSLIEITKKDTVELAPPTDAQIEARNKIIANYMAKVSAEQKNPNAPYQLPYQLTEQDMAIANELSPMEMAERNKEYALYTMAILAKIYTDEVEKQTGNIVPMTDIPGTSAMVDSLRYSQNAGVKVAAIDALRHIQRPEYKEELTALYTLAQSDGNPQVAIAAQRALESINHN